MLRVYHILFSTVTLYTLGFLLFHGVGIIDFLSHISNLVNLLAGGIFLYLGIANNKKIHKIDQLRSVTLVYVVTIGIAFMFLKERELGPMMLSPWVSLVQHKLIPAAVVVEWVLLPPARQLNINIGNIFKLLIFPVVYFLYTQIYGYFTSSYPYKFLNPQTNGYASIFLHFLVVSAGGLLIYLVAIFVGNILQKSS